MKSFRKTDEGFHPAYPQSAGESAQSQTVTHFRFRREFWDWVQSDPLLKAEWEQLISEKVNTRFEPLRAQFEKQSREEQEEKVCLAQKKGQEEGFEVGRQKGYEQAYTERTKDLEVAAEAIRSVVNAISSAQSEVIAAHASAWLDTLQLVARQCLVPRPHELIKAVKDWLENELTEFEKNKKIRVSVPASEFEQYQQALVHAPNESLRLYSSEGLEPGDIRVECDNGGLLFSDKASLEKLQDAIQSVRALS